MLDAKLARVGSSAAPPRGFPEAAFLDFALLDLAAKVRRCSRSRIPRCGNYATRKQYWALTIG
jgi:hypothetical protein